MDIHRLGLSVSTVLLQLTALHEVLQQVHAMQDEGSVGEYT
jgi:hypothetical protein